MPDNKIIKLKIEELETLLPRDTGRKSSYRLRIPFTARRSGIDQLFTWQAFVASNATVTAVTGAANGTTETNLETFELAGITWHVGQTVRITAIGVYSTANASDTVTIRVGSGGAPTTEWNSAVSTAASVTNQPWHFTWIGIVASLGSSGTLEAQMVGRINNVNKDDPNTSAVTFNTNSTITIGLTAQWSAGTSGNTASIRQFIIEVIN